MLAQGFFGKDIQLTRLHVPLDLTIPCSRIELCEPSPKFREFFGRQSGNPSLKRFDFAHTRNDTTFSFCELTRLLAQQLLGKSY